MNWSLITLTAIALALGAPALAQSQSQSPSPPAAPAAANKSAVADADLSFVQQAAAAGMAEVEAGKLAMERATSEQVKSFARTMVEDHTAANQKLSDVARSQGVALPKSSDKAHQAEKQKLASLNGAAFDRAYMNAQLDDHRKAVALFERQSRNGGNAELKRFAADTLPKLQGHLSMAESLTKVADSSGAAPGATDARPQARASSRAQSVRAEDEQARARTAELNRQQFEKAKAGQF